MSKEAELIRRAHENYKAAMGTPQGPAEYRVLEQVVAAVKGRRTAARDGS